MSLATNPQIVPHEIASNHVSNLAKIRIANFAVDPVNLNQSSHNDDKDRATSSTSHKSKSSVPCTTSSLFEEMDLNFVLVHGESEYKFTDNLDLKTDILDPLPSDTFYEDTSNSLPSTEQVIIDLCEDEDKPSTSQKSVKAPTSQNSAIFQNRHEKFSTNNIQFMNERNNFEVDKISHSQKFKKRKNNSDAIIEILVDEKNSREMETNDETDSKRDSSEDEEIRTKANYVDKHECPWSFLQNDKKCPQLFSICSFNDVEALSEHMSTHLSFKQKNIQIFD